MNHASRDAAAATRVSREGAGSARRAADREFDVAVVGAGVVGLAHAWALARRGQRVAVFERAARAGGASIRNFGMLWPIGQPLGDRSRLAHRSLEIWHEVLSQAGLWHERRGSLHLAHQEDERRVLLEFSARAKAADVSCEWLEAEAAVALAPRVERRGLLGALFSPSETCVDPREVVADLPAWLAREYGVRFEFGCGVTAWQDGEGVAGGERFRARRIVVCPGDDLTTLFPQALADAGLVACKLQMMRSDPLAAGERIGPMLAAGPTLRHYAAFADCPSLPAVRERFARERPELDRFGIHVMAAQNGRGEIVIGDSHVYGDEVAPFDDPAIDALVLGVLERFLRIPELRISARWHGIYARHPSQPWVVGRPAADAVVVTGLGGAGMTFSFGLAEQVVGEVLADG